MKRHTSHKLTLRTGAMPELASHRSRFTPTTHSSELYNLIVHITRYTWSPRQSVFVGTLLGFLGLLHHGGEFRVVDHAIRWSEFVSTLHVDVHIGSRGCFVGLLHHGGEFGVVNHAITVDIYLSHDVTDDTLWSVFIG